MDMTCLVECSAFKYVPIDKIQSLGCELGEGVRYPILEVKDERVIIGDPSHRPP